MTCSTCPNCGIDLQRFDKIERGHLMIEGNVAVHWKGYRLKLSVQERLLLLGIVRSDGALVPDHAMAEIIGYDGDDPCSVINVLICRIRAKLREIDPLFDSIERNGDARWARGSRWRADAYIVPELAEATATQRSLHKLMLQHPGASIMEWAALQGRTAHSSLYAVLKALERRKLVRREKQYQRGWTAIGTLEMHAEIDRRCNNRPRL